MIGGKTILAGDDTMSARPAHRPGAGVERARQRLLAKAKANAKFYAHLPADKPPSRQVLRRAAWKAAKAEARRQRDKSARAELDTLRGYRVVRV